MTIKMERSTCPNQRMYAVDVVALGTMRSRCVTTGLRLRLPCGLRGNQCEDEQAVLRCAQEHAVGSSCNMQHGIQAHFSARTMGVHDSMGCCHLLPFRWLVNGLNGINGINGINRITL